MPKLKTNSGAKKRFKLTKNGRVIRSNTNKRHLLAGKTTKRKRHLRKSTIAVIQIEKRIKKMMPYISR